MPARTSRRNCSSVAGLGSRKPTLTLLTHIDEQMNNQQPILAYQSAYYPISRPTPASIFSANLHSLYHLLYNPYTIQIMQKVSILPLGAGCEVGRSCIILTINNKSIMLDCGLMINKGGEEALPLFDKFNAEDLSMVIITHAHLDHCGALPYFLAKYNYKKKVYMTKPTEHIYHYLVKDTLKVRNEDKVLFSQEHVTESLNRIEEVKFGVEIEEEGIKVTPYVAGHIVGAAMFVIEIDGVKVLYTGDFSCEEDRYIMQAEIPPTNVDILISESTFGTSIHHDRHIREQNFKQEVKKIVKRGGKCLLPVFSAGRAEELLFILDQFWDQNIQQLKHVRIYYTIELIDKCKKIYQTYVDMLSQKIQQKFYKQSINPFDYKHIHYLRSKQKIDQEENNPMVVMCTPGMLQNGQSRTLLQKWCHDEKNGVIITGYCADGSVASNLKLNSKIVSMSDDKREIRTKLSVQDISFAAHADCLQITKFIKKVKPMYVVLVHGSSKNSENLREYLQKEFPEIKKVACGKNLETLDFEIQIREKYLIAGQLKTNIEKTVKSKKEETTEFQGYIVNTQNHKVLVNKQDKDRLFPNLKGMQILQKITVKYPGTLTLANLLAMKIFGDSKIVIKDGDEYMVIKDKIWMSILEKDRSALVQFISSPKNDIIADQFCYLLSNILYDPFLQKSLKSSEQFPKEWQQVLTLIGEDYPESVINQELISVIRKGETLAIVNLRTKSVDCRDQYTRFRLLGIMGDVVGEGQGEGDGRIGDA